MSRRRAATVAVCGLAVLAVGMAGAVGPVATARAQDTIPPTSQPPASQPPATQALTPAGYVAIALDFIEARAYRRPTVDWPSIRQRAEQLAAAAPGIVDTYPIITEAVRALKDNHSSFTRPPDAARQTAGKSNGFGFLAVASSRQVVTITDGGPAAQAGLRVGDRIDKVNGKAPRVSGGVITIPRDANGQFPTTVALTWLPKGKKKTVTRTLTLGEVTLVSVPKAAPVPSANGQSLGRLGYLEIPGIVGDDAAQRTYASQVQAQIRGLETEQARCGWIVDLRRNRGGYIYAMLAGLGPLLDGGAPGSLLGGQLTASGQRYEWRYLDGVTLVNLSKTVSVDAPFRLPRPDVPVAVLTSSLTASAGEAITISFRGRPNARSFGEATDGLTTFNERKAMPDGAFLDIMSAVDIDRNGVGYEGPVPPDQPVTIDWNNVLTPNDPVLAAATTWLTSQPMCTAP